MKYAKVTMCAVTLVTLASLPATIEAQTPSPTQAAPAAPAKAVSGYTFPQKIGQAELVGTQDFEPKAPGLGQVGQYKFQGWRLSIYVYDKQRKDLGETVNTTQATAELDESLKEVYAAQKLGHYVKVEEGTAFAIPPLGSATTFHCRSLKLALKPQQPDAANRPVEPYESYRCVTTSRKKFVKLILSSDTPHGHQATVFTPVAASIELFGRMLAR